MQLPEKFTLQLVVRAVTRIKFCALTTWLYSLLSFDGLVSGTSYHMPYYYCQVCCLFLPKAGEVTYSPLIGPLDLVAVMHGDHLSVRFLI